MTAASPGGDQPRPVLRPVDPSPAPETPPARPESALPPALVRAAANGERDAMHRLLSYLRPLILRYCRARIGRWDRSFGSADDVAQEVCIAVLRALPSYVDQGRPFLAFVYGIAQHKVADAHRAASRIKADPVGEVPEVNDGSAGPEALALAGELTERVAGLLRLLPARQQEILRLRVVLGLSAEETAEAIGSTPGAVRVAQHRALARLRDHPMLADFTLG